MPGLLEAVKAWLRTQHHIHVPEDWLEACADWIQNEQGSLSPGQLRQAVYEQWLVSDLRELAHPSLPEGLSTAEKFVLEGKYSLQVDSVRDVSQPCYGQLKKLQGRDNENASVTATTQNTQKPWEAKPNRMLLLSMTDGVQDVQGMEYQPIRHIDINIAAGAKVSISGRVLCRLGVLMLRCENVVVLGGEVETLVETNAHHNVLARALSLDPANLPVNLRPKASVGLITSLTAPTQQNPTQGRTLSQPLNCQNSNPNSANRWSPSSDRRRTVSAPTVDEFDDADDSIFNEIDKDLLDEHWGEMDDVRGDVVNRLNVPKMTSRPIVRLDSHPNVGQFSSTLANNTRLNNSAVRRVPVTTGAKGNSKINISSDSVGSASDWSMADQSKFATSHSDMDCDFPDDDDFELYQISDVVSSKSIGRKTDQVGDKNVHALTSAGDCINRPITGASRPVTSSDVHALTSGGDCINRPITSASRPVTSSGDVHALTSAGDCINRPITSASRPVTSSGDAPLQQFESIHRGGRNSVTSSAAPSSCVKGTIQSLQSPANESLSAASFDVDCILLSDDSMDGCTGATSPKRARPDDDRRSLTERIRQLYASRHRLRTTEVPLSLDTEPYIYLRQLAAILPLSTPTTVKVKAYISTVVRKLDHNRGQFWSLGVKLNDGTASLDVSLTDQVIVDLMGATAAETIRLRREGAHNPEIRQHLEQMLSQFQRKLIDISCIFELEMTPNTNEPRVMQLIEFTEHHVQALYDRLQQGQVGLE